MKAGEIITAMQDLRVTQGSRLGELFEVLPWEQRFIRGAFQDGVEVSGLSVARGNGKTTLIAALCTAYLLDGRRYNADIIVCASSFNQAKICQEQVLRFLRGTYKPEAIKRTFRIQDSQNNALIENRFTGLRLRCVGSDSKRLHGLQFTLAILDEGAQWVLGGQTVYNAIITSLGKLPNARVLAIGTKPVDNQHWFSKLLADSTTGYSQVHEVPAESDTIFQARTWKLANPSMDHLPDLRKSIKRESLVAKKDFNALLAFRAYRLNQGTDEENADNHLIAAESWREVEVDGIADRGDGLIWGLDLSGGASLSALSAYWMDSLYLESIALVGDIPTLRERGLADGVGTLYLEFADEGSLITSRGKSACIITLLKEGLKRFGMPKTIVCDRWRANELEDALRELNIRAKLSYRGMGFQDGSEDVERFRKALLTGFVKPKKQLLARHCFGGCRTVQDAAGNQKITKTGIGRRIMHRDDVAVSSVLAVAAGSRIRERLKKSTGLRFW